MDTVLRSTSKKLGVEKSSLKCFRPAQGLRRMPSFSRKSLNARVTPYMGIYLKITK